MKLVEAQDAKELLQRVGVEDLQPPPKGEGDQRTHRLHYKSYLLVEMMMKMMTMTT